MPGKQTAQASKPAAPSAVAPSRSPAGRARAGSATGQRDEDYALISVLYHALQGADTIAQYIEDAREANDEELASFLEETREVYVAQANEAKQLLADRLEANEDEEEDEDDDDEEEEEEEEED
jgi:ABC-type Zn2+ transport system substrate-binding protein/surface adhesin